MKLQSVREHVRIYLPLSVPSQVHIGYSLSSKYICAEVKKCNETGNN